MSIFRIKLYSSFNIFNHNHDHVYITAIELEGLQGHLCLYDKLLAYRLKEIFDAFSVLLQRNGFWLKEI